MHNGAIDKIQTQIELFYRKFYLYKVVLGIVLSVTAILSTFLLLSFTEYLGRFSSEFRLVLLVLFLVLSVGLVAWKVFFPAMQLLKWQKGLNEEALASIIGKHFKGAIDDQLLNLLQIKNAGESNSLSVAAIEQKAEKLQQYDFRQALNNREIKQWLLILLFPLLIVSALSIWNPSVLKDGSQRIMAFNKEFVAPNPYYYEILNDPLEAKDDEAFLLKIAFKGPVVPSSLFITINGKTYRTQAEGGLFTYNFGVVYEPTPFTLQMGEYTSKTHVISLVHSPSVFSWQAKVQPPSYTKVTPFETENTATISAPEGTRIILKSEIKHGEENIVVIESNTRDTIQLLPDESIVFTLNKRTTRFSIIAKQNELSDQVIVGVNVIPDNHPEIAIKSFQDTVLNDVHFFSGSAIDDYGIQSVEFVAENQDTSFIIPIQTEGNPLNKRFNFSIDFSAIQPSIQSLKYFFRVWDNDKINGSKSAISSTLFYTPLTDEAKDSIVKSKGDELAKKMEQVLNQAKNQKQELKDIQNMLKEKESMNWEDKKRVEEYFSEQEKLQQQIEEIQKLKNQRNQQQENFSKKEETLKKKQEALDKLFEELMDDETKEMMKKLQELMKKLADKNQIQEELKSMEMSNEQMEQQLDRTLELFKQLEVEQMLEENTKKMEKLAKEQMNLSKEKNIEESLEKQEELDKKFEQLKKDMQDMREKNNALQSPKAIENTKDKENGISKDQKEASEEMQKGNQKKGQSKQNNAGQKMKSLSNDLQQMQESMQQQEQSENIATLRQILENLIYLSLEQEKLLEQFKKINRFDPTYRTLTAEQKKLIDDAVVIEDSLTALAKRQPNIQPIVQEELRNMKFNMSESLEQLSERQSYQAVVNQQKVMQSANTLALLLDEALQQMQNQMMQQKFGQNSCNKPGGSPKPGESMQQLKKMLSKQIQQMKKMMEEGGEQDGKKGKEGNGKEQGFAKMAQRQAAMKEKLRQLEKELQKQGGGLGDQHSLEHDLEKIEENLYNKELNNELIQRQERILTKMLEAEKSINEREMDEKRKSHSGKNKKDRNLIQYAPYKTVDNKNNELLETAPQQFKLYYRTKVSKYFNNFE